MSNPKVSIIMPVYNAELYLKDSIDSILNQTYLDYEFIIINDGSTDRTDEIIRGYSDGRIKYVINDVNIKLIKTLNKGLLLSRGEFIARMDADDIANEKRIELQVAEMQNENVVVCGTQIEFIDSDSNKISRTYRYPTDEIEIIGSTLFRSPIAHPSAMIRRSSLIENKIIYDQNYPHAEDTKLWIDLLSHGSIVNLEDVMLKYRLSDTQISSVYSAEQKQNSFSARELHFKNIIKKFDFNIEDNSITDFELKKIIGSPLVNYVCTFIFCTNMKVARTELIKCYLHVMIHGDSFSKKLVNIKLLRKVFCV